MSAAIAINAGKTILIACHKPPPYHNLLTKINMAELKRIMNQKGFICVEKINSQNI